jgi:cytochrome c5
MSTHHMNKSLKLSLLVVLPLLAPVLQAAEWVDTSHATPETLFAEKCGMCHRAQGMGTTLLARRYDPETALLENRRDLQGEFIRTVVRSGFNNMFPISRGEVSDAQLDSIVEHLTREQAQ